MNQRENWHTDTPRPFPREPDYECEPIPTHPSYRNRHEIVDQMDVSPDAWCMTPTLAHPNISGKRDFLDKLRVCEAWGKYLNIPAKILISIRNKTNALSKTLELGGHVVSVSEVKEYARFVNQNWPTIIPRGENGEKLAPSGPLEQKVLSIYGGVIDEDLSAAKQLVGLQKWVTRRSKFKTYAKFANILNCLSREMGPPFFGVIKKLQLRLDLILAMDKYTLGQTPVIINDYTNSYNEWLFEMFSSDATYKKVGGHMVKTSGQRILISESEYYALIVKRREMGEEEPSSEVTTTDSSDSLPPPPPQQFLLSSENSSSGCWSDEEIVMQGP